MRMGGMFENYELDPESVINSIIQMVTVRICQLRPLVASQLQLFYMGCNTVSQFLGFFDMTFCLIRMQRLALGELEDS